MEDIEHKRKRAKEIFEILDPLYTKDKTALKYKTPFELLVSTILSAQCTDKRVNEVTGTLFEKYRTPADYARAPVSELEDEIRSTGFFKNKAKAIKGSSEAIIERHGGKVPSTMEELVQLPGVGRKTANLVLGVAFGVPGVVVDTHVKRLSNRLGLTESPNADRIETDIQNLLDREKWTRFSDVLIYHGRAVCKSRKPDHVRCAVSHLCPSNSI